MLGLNQYNPFFGFSSLYQFIHMSNLIFQAKVNKINGITKTNVEYEVQFKKNLELIKEKFRKEIKTELSFDEVVKSTEKLRVFKESTKKEDANEILNYKIYCFLCSLAFYEVDSAKTHDLFCESDWDEFAELLNFLTKEDVTLIKDEIFKKNAVNYKWTNQEDQLLKSLISKYQAKGTRIVLWKKLTLEFNQQPCISQIRTPSHCQERWKNALRNKFKIGDWTKEEDQKIIAYALTYGTKWSKVAKLCEGRTEHNVKNRFFGLISKLLHTPIRKIKTSINYKNRNILKDILNDYEGQKFSPKIDEKKIN